MGWDAKLRREERTSPIDRVSEEGAAKLVPLDRIEAFLESVVSIVPTSSMYSMSSDETEVRLRERPLRVLRAGCILVVRWDVEPDREAGCLIAAENGEMRSEGSTGAGWELEDPPPD